MAREKRKRPRVIVSKNAFSRFLKKKFGYTDVRQFATSGAFSSRLNSVLLAKDESGNDVFIKACRYGDMSEKCILILEIMSYKKVGNEEIPNDILIQIIDSKDPTKIIKQGKKNGLSDAFSIGLVWLDMALKK